MSQLYHLIEYQVADRVATITLNRPTHQNALNDLLIIELRDAFHAGLQAPDAKVIVLKAKGGAFCVGADLAYLQQVQAQGLDQNQADSASLAQLMLLMYRSPKVIIAQVEGNATAEGSGLMAVCDFVFAVPEAKFGFPEVKMGLVPAIAMPFLLRKVGEARTREMLLGGQLLDAATAKASELINEVVPREGIAQWVYQFAQKLCRENSFASMQLIKKMMADVPDFPLENAIKFAAKMNAHARMTDDARKGILGGLKGDDIQW